jgi:hypothetical protein
MARSGSSSATMAPNWRSARADCESGVDLRESKALVSPPNGRLMLLFGGSFYQGRKVGLRRGPGSSFSESGRDALRPHPAPVSDRSAYSYRWRLALACHLACVATRLRCALPVRRGGWRVQGAPRQDARRYRLPGSTQPSRSQGRPNETYCPLPTRPARWSPGCGANAAIRLAGSDSAALPTRDWTWKEQTARLGGPNLIALAE